jgi:HTH-type transcriptional regulator, cell division transcriptional repressor
MSMSDIIKKRRDELDLTLLDIAKKAGVSEATVQRYESGSIKNIRQDKIGKLAAALQLTPAQLLGWEEIQSEETKNKGTSVPDIDSKESKSRSDDPDQIFCFLEKLADLHDKGILTDEEYIGKKRELLDRL